MIRKLILSALLTATSQFAYAQEVNVAFGSSKAPFVMNDNKTGIEISLAREALKRAGYEMKVMVVANKRLLDLLKDKEVDASVSIPKVNPDFFYSQAFISFDNYVVAKKKKHYEIKSFNDLKGKSLVSWQNAPMDLNNPEFTAMVNSKAINLTENSKQEAQVETFLLDRFDGIVIDKTILRYQTNIIKSRLKLKDEEIEFDYFKLFPGVTSLYVGFRDQNLRDKFEKSLAEMKADGSYDKIIESVIKEVK